MRPTFPTYGLKMRAKTAMRGKFWTALATSVLPAAIVCALTATVVCCVPGAAGSVTKIVSGSFDSAEAKAEYVQTVMRNLMYAFDGMNVLFSFLSVGAIKMRLDMVRGKEVKAKNLFCFFDRWYIAAVYPLLSAAVTVLTAVLEQMAGAVAAGGVLLAVAAVKLKLFFVQYALADNGCKSFVQAVKSAWKMTGVSTIVNVIVLEISFVGWFFASAFTGGIAMIYAMPYINLAEAALYDANREFAENAENGM